MHCWIGLLVPIQSACLICWQGASVQSIWSTHFTLRTTMGETQKYRQQEDMSTHRRAPTFPLGSDRKISMSYSCIPSRAVFSLCIPCCPSAQQQQQAPSAAGFNPTKGLALLVPPKDSLESVDTNSSSTPEGSRRSYNVLKRGKWGSHGYL